MEKVSVSVILPMYSYAQYLDEAIQSVLAQSVQPYEIICVSDGAIDNSVEIARKYPVTIIEKENGGLSSARNAGIAAATGKYMMSFDSDDIMRPDCIKEHLLLADENSIVTCGLMAFGSENYIARPKVATIEQLLKTNVIYSNTLFPKQAWIDAGGFDEDMINGWEDLEFWIRVLEKGYKSKVSNKIALLWRRHQQTMSNMADTQHEKLWKYIREKHKHLLPTT